VSERFVTVAFKLDKVFGCVPVRVNDATLNVVEAVMEGLVIKPPSQVKVVTEALGPVILNVPDSISKTLIFAVAD